MSFHGFFTPNLLTKKSVEIQGNKIAKKYSRFLAKEDNIENKHMYICLLSNHLGTANKRDDTEC